jgi:putative ABC transport system substrate-binding protein
MKRRDVMALLGGAMLIGQLVGARQELRAAERVYRLGELAPSAPSVQYTREVTLPELAKLGFEQGRNLIVDERVGTAGDMPRLASEILRANPDAILAIGGDAIRATMDVTSTVPIVAFGAPPVEVGLVRRNSNLTGVVILAAELDAKRLDLLREAVPAAKRIAALLLPNAPLRDATETALRGVATNAGLELLIFDATGPADYPAAFEAMRKAGAQALVVMANARFNRDTELITGLALTTGLATVCEWADMARAGCLLGYGPIRAELRRRVAFQIAHLFRGAAPGDLPIELPIHYEFAVNLKTAQALGITIPQSVLVRADEAFE